MLKKSMFYFSSLFLLFNLTACNKSNIIKYSVGDSWTVNVYEGIDYDIEYLELTEDFFALKFVKKISSDVSFDFVL